MDLEAELGKSISGEELEGKIAEKIKSFHGFLTREVAIRLIAKEKGILRQEDKTYKLAEIPKGEKKISFIAKIRKVWPTAAYASGKKSRVVEVSDESGSKPLVLWNEDVELANSLRENDKIAVKGAYEKSGELHLGYSGNIEVTEKAGFSRLYDIDEGVTVHVRGFVSSLEGMDSFVRESGTVRGFSFILNDGENERRVIVTQGMDRAERLKAGDEVILEGARVRNGNLELGSESRLKARRGSEMLLGTLKKLECADERLLVEVEGKEVTLDRENALRLLGVRVAGDITLSTVVDLKKSSLLNTRIAVKIKDGQIGVRC